jgi:hypothetical protein
MDATLNVTDFFAPYNEGALDAAGLDMGTSGALLLPDQPGSHPQMMVGTNKNGDVYLVDRNNLGHWNSDNNGNIVQYLPRALGNNPNRNQAYGCAAYWNGNVYFVGAVDTLKQFSLSGGFLSSGPVCQSATVISNVRGATPVVSASGTANGIVWVTSTTGAIGSNAVLHAYLATNVGTELYNSNENPNDTAGTIVKFTPPLVVNGRVYVAGANGVWVYGLLP